MPTIAHAIHPVVVPPESDLTIAQPITFETMRIARSLAPPDLRVCLYAVQYADEERLPLPGCFARTQDLQRSVADLKAFARRRKLAVIADILDRLYDAAPQADYLIYNNVDIALQPPFYAAVGRLIDLGHDALVINRRTVSARWRDPVDIPLMWADVGDAHPGWDCFVFRRDVYTLFRLGHVCVGTGWIGRAMLTNMACLSRHFRVVPDMHLTFHIGNDHVWKQDEYVEYFEHNRDECRLILEHFDRTVGPLDPASLPGRFLRAAR